MKRLHNIMCRPLVDTPRTRRYQGFIDDAVEKALKEFDTERGLMHTKGVDLPDERIAGYVDMPLAERKAVTSDEAARALHRASTRNTAGVLGAMAFCHRSPLSRYHDDPRILENVVRGLRAFHKRFRAGGQWIFGLTPDHSPEDWGAGWTVEGLIYSYVWLYDKLDPAFPAELLDMFRRAAVYYATVTPGHAVSNQQAVWCMAMALYGQLLNEPKYLDAAARQWQVCQHVFARDGQVIEQGGPDANYSRTAFIYAYLYLLFAENRAHDGQIKDAVKWFRRMHTNSMHPFEGMSARQYHFLTHAMVDVIPACERFAAEEPVFAHFADEFIAQEIRDQKHVSGLGHGASPLAWAILACQELPPAPASAAAAGKSRPFDRMYWKWDIQYALIHRKYQTAVTLRGRMPLAGLQTWAWGDEPPILHPTLDVGSTTQAWGIDTAEFSVGRNRAGRGAGSKSEEVLYVPGNWDELGLRYPPTGVDGGVAEDPCTRYMRHTQTHHHPGGLRQMMKPGDPAQIVTRWGKLWVQYIFTPTSTVVIQNGDVGPRMTRWAFNRVCVPQATLGSGCITFEGREGRIHHFSGAAWLALREGVPCAEFDFGPKELGAFAFSDGSFRFIEYDVVAQTLKFADADGTYVADFSKAVGADGYLIWHEGARVNKVEDLGEEGGHRHR
jgi:hypothetical protein